MKTVMMMSWVVILILGASGTAGGSLTLDGADPICPEGTALRFDGQNDYVLVPDNDSLSPLAVGTGEITVSAWINLAQFPNTSQGRFPAVAKGTTDQWEYALYVYKDGRACFVVWQLSGLGHGEPKGGSITLGEWYHLAGTCKKNQYVRIHIDGTLAAETTVLFGAPGNGSSPLYFGRRGDGQFFDGLVDEICMWSSARTQGQIQAHMHKRLIGDEPGLVGYWNLDEGWGQNVYDLSANANHGSLGDDPYGVDDGDPLWVDSNAPAGLCPAEAIAVIVDIKPQSCPNPVNVASRGVLPVAILGSEDFDVNSIDPASIRIAGVAPIRSSIEDVAAPPPDGNECECAATDPDGYNDLTLKFKTQDIMANLAIARSGLVDGDVLSLTLTGELFDETSIEGADCVTILGTWPRWLYTKASDVNRDGIINMLDFTLMVECWLEFSDLGE